MTNEIIVAKYHLALQENSRLKADLDAALREIDTLNAEKEILLGRELPVPAA